MFRVSLSFLISLHLAVFLSTIFVIWISYVLARHWRDRRLARHRVRCGICTHEFDDRSGVLLPKCPRCGSLNERLMTGRI